MDFEKKKLSLQSNGKKNSEILSKKLGAQTAEGANQ